MDLAGHSWCVSHGLLCLRSSRCRRHRQVQVPDWSLGMPPNAGRASEARRRIPGTYAPPLQRRQIYIFSLHSYTRARRAVGPRIGTACFAHQHDSDWQSCFVLVVGNRGYLCPFRIIFPTTRTKCGGSYCRVFLGCNARPCYRIVETSRARVAHPVDRSAGDAPTPRGATVPREHKS